MRYVFLPRARRDLREIADRIAIDKPRRAATFVQDLIQECRLIASDPYLWPGRDDLPAHLRRVPFGKYLIIYSIQVSVVRIERIVHGARDLPALFE